MMKNPLVLATWSFGKIATAAAWGVLERGGGALDAVEAGCKAVELDPTVDSVGFGGLPDRTGRVSLDGCIMMSPARCGSVAGLRRHVHPVSLARCIMEKTQHVMVVGGDADALADHFGLVGMDLLHDSAAEHYQQWRKDFPAAAADLTVPWRPKENIEEHRQKVHDTVGVLAVDAAGRLAGACSTSGHAYKIPGRVGDSPIIGHGLYVHPQDGAAVATGTGELVMGVCGTFLAVELMRRGASPLDALMEVLTRVQDSYDLLPEQQVGMIALRPDGTWAHAALHAGYRTHIRSADRNELMRPDKVLLAKS